MQDKTNPFAFYAGLHLLFAFYANIVKGECRDKRELYFRFDYAEPNPVFVFTNIVKGECKGKRKYDFRLPLPKRVLHYTNIGIFSVDKPVGLFELKLLPTIPKVSTPKRDKVNKEK